MIAKNIKNLLVILAFPVLSCAGLFAQSNAYKAVNYKVPIYPPAARALRATGEVTVDVVIDKDGKVTSSIAKTGHPLLKQTCEKAAQEWRFKAVENVEKREAKITFNFLLEAKNKEDKVRFKKPYRLEIRPAFSKMLDTPDY